ncbi:hypothetical protein B9T31_04210 [Acinetobacter sp. ANC 4558]|uniref:baseplate J/gp47 family protein n=1 Tax=Acinetobacter sp. ANC 4558 TaxID=1977876 RepID=UPI000A33037B|nr:baseplate J/gp47 family protein [Acinetobacter sp. ANC 4558]OTG87708.1 hypothetical protein B9T31_04210 [Acinetobacter sp. ANC 4558]
MYPIPSFNKLYLTIVQEIRSLTGLTITDDSDAGIRASGTVAIVEGLYHQQQYIQKQLFVATADEPFLYIHAEEIGLPRQGGTFASGQIQAIANENLSIVAGHKLTNGKGYYWTVVEDILLQEDIQTVVSVVADQAGTSWNMTDGSLLWVSPPAGLDGSATVISIGGGTDQEQLEVWRLRLLERKRLGEYKDRRDDIEFMARSTGDVEHVYHYPKRRGLGSYDIGITAKGTPPTVPSPDLLQEVQSIMDAYIGDLTDCRVFSPTPQLVNISVVLTGGNIEDVKELINNYFAELAPSDPYQYAILLSRIISIGGVTDATLTPNFNIVPEVTWQHLYWLRLGSLEISNA